MTKKTQSLLADTRALKVTDGAWSEDTTDANMMCISADGTKMWLLDPSPKSFDWIVLYNERGEDRYFSISQREGLLYKPVATFETKIEAYDHYEDLLNNAVLKGFER